MTRKNGKPEKAKVEKASGYDVSPVYSKKNLPYLWTTTKKLVDIVSLRVNITREGHAILSMLDSEAFIAGSSAIHMLETGLPRRSFNDIDVFFLTEKSIKKTFDNLISSGFVVQPKSTKFQIQMRKEGFPHTLSLVKMRVHDSIERALDTFDFTVVQVGFNAKYGVFANKFALEDEKANNLCIHDLSKSQDWLFRLAKYIKKGYEPTVQAVNAIDDYLKGKYSKMTNKTEAPSEGTRVPMTGNGYVPANVSVPVPTVNMGGLGARFATLFQPTTVTRTGSAVGTSITTTYSGDSIAVATIPMASYGTFGGMGTIDGAVSQNDPYDAPRASVSISQSTNTDPQNDR